MLIRREQSMSSEPTEITWVDIFGNEVKTETYDLNKKTDKEGK